MSPPADAQQRRVPVEFTVEAQPALQVHKVAIVTGSSGGLGRAIATSFAKAGYDLVLHYHKNAEVAEALADGLRNGVETTTYRGDLGRRAAADGLIAHALQEFGQVDVLVNNAGVKVDAPLTKLRDEDWDAVLQGNLTAAMRTTRAALPGMYARGFGRVINMASVGGQTGYAGTAAYAASKAGLIGLTKAIAAEAARKGVTCNAIAPGLIDAGMGAALHPKAYEGMVGLTPAGRPGQPHEVGDLAVFLASPAAGFITGQVLAVNGGLYM